jgi:glycosyltransferase involved in cell wall biosynthesis
MKVKNTKSIQRKSKLKRQARIPELSVIMPVYNGEAYLAQAINSVIKQSYRNFELIIIDDASQDGSGKIIERFVKRYPSRILAFQNDKRVGRARTLNRQIALSRGDFIARMDAVDIALPERFATQIAYLKNHTKTIAVGGQCLVINEKGKISGERKLPIGYDDIYKYILNFCPTLQPTIMIAKKRLPYDFEYYNTGFSFIEGLEFLFRIFKYGRVENVPEYILMQRQIDKNTTQFEAKKAEIKVFLSHLNGIINHGYRPNAQGILHSTLILFITLFIPKKAQTFIAKYIKVGSSIYPVSKKILRKYSYFGII